MKKLVLIFLVGLLSVSFAEVSDDEIEAILDDCMVNKNPVACKALIDNDLPETLEQCNKISCVIVGGIYYLAGYTDEVIKHFEKSFALGNYSASLLLNKIYKEKGNFTESKKYAKIACEKIDTKTNDDKAMKGDGCLDLGLMYQLGQGVGQDFHKAFQHYKKACDLGNASGCNNLGYFYDNGKGVKQNKSTAKQYFGKACDLGEQMGCDNYRILNESGVQ